MGGAGVLSARLVRATAAKAVEDLRSPRRFARYGASRQSTRPWIAPSGKKRGADGLGITVSYWASEEAKVAWRNNWEHLAAQDAGRRVWYGDYQVRIARVERSYGKASQYPEWTGLTGGIRVNRD